MARRGRGLTPTLIAITCAIVTAGCEALDVHDAASLFAPTLHRSEIVGLIAGMGTTFAALPDLLTMLRTRSSAGMNPRMAAITGTFQVLWIYYGLLTVARPVIIWNAVGVVINFISVAAYRRFG